MKLTHLLVLLWCLHMPGLAEAGDRSAQQADPFTVVQIALSGSGIGLSVAGIAAQNERDFPACVTVEVLRPSFDVAYTVVRDRAGGIPAVRADLSGCLAFASTQPRAVLEARVGELVDGLVGSTLRSVESAVAASGDLPCRDAVILAGVFQYLDGLTGTIVRELVEPDGEISISPVTFDQARCAEFPPARAAAPPAAPSDEAGTGQADQSKARSASAAGGATSSDPSSARSTTPSGDALPSSGEGDLATRLSTLKSLYDQGLITAEDYEQRKAQILSEL